MFEGFLPRKAGERRARLDALAADPRTIVVFESPKRVRAMVAEALDALGDRPAAVARELTKLHEQVLRGCSPSSGDARRRDVEGEVVVVIGGASEADAPDIDVLVDETQTLVADGERPRDAAKPWRTDWHVGERDLPCRLVLDDH